MCQKANYTVGGYVLGFRQHVTDVLEPLRWLVSPLQQLKGQNDHEEEIIGFNFLLMTNYLHFSNYYNFLGNA